MIGPILSLNEINNNKTNTRYKKNIEKIFIMAFMSKQNKTDADDEPKYPGR